LLHGPGTGDALHSGESLRVHPLQKTLRANKSVTAPNGPAKGL
jgi:hypothetical protein